MSFGSGGGFGFGQQNSQQQSAPFGGFGNNANANTGKSPSHLLYHTAMQRSLLYQTGASKHHGNQQLSDVVPSPMQASAQLHPILALATRPQTRIPLEQVVASARILEVRQALWLHLGGPRLVYIYGALSWSWQVLVGTWWSLALVGRFTFEYKGCPLRQFAANTSQGASLKTSRRKHHVSYMDSCFPSQDKHSCHGASHRSCTYRLET